MEFFDRVEKLSPIPGNLKCEVKKKLDRDITQKFVRDFVVELCERKYPERLSATRPGRGFDGPLGPGERSRNPTGTPGGPV